jgi:RNA polymerase sigma factor (sigma-70 family)
MSLSSSEHHSPQNPASTEVRRAFADLAARHLHSVRAVVRSVLPRRMRNRLDSTDIIQDVWMSALSRLSRLPSEMCSRRVVPFLKKAARIRVYEEYRHHTAAKRNLKVETSPADLGEHPYRGPAVEDEVADREQIEVMRHSLGEQEREVLDRLLAGQDQTSIAQDMGISRGRVYRILNRLARREMMK